MMKVDTLVVGSGLCGRVLAQRLGPDDLIIERGEERSYDEMLRRYRLHSCSTKPEWENSRHAFRSDLSFNQLYDLSGDTSCFSQFEFIGGGSSNRWDGKSRRIPEYIFSSRDYIAWPFQFNEILPYYVKAEGLLNVSAVYDHTNYGDAQKIVWGTLSDLLTTTGLSGEFVNIATNPSLCPNGLNDTDALSFSKFRPQHLQLKTPIKFGVISNKILFDRSRAIGVICRSADGEILIEFEKMVISANGIESAKILYDSDLPRSVNQGVLGHYFQDHAQCNLMIGCPFNFSQEFGRSSKVFDISNYAGSRYGVDIRVSIQSPEFNRDGFRGSGEMNPRDIAEMKITYEVPPERESYVDFEGKHPVVRFKDWAQNVHKYNKILDEILKDLETRGFVVLKVFPHFRHIFGQHHLVGTLNMSLGTSGIVGPDFRLTGTDNVFIAGSSLIPRIGAANPTLTAVALSLKLAESF